MRSQLSHTLFHLSVATLYGQKQRLSQERAQEGAQEKAQEEQLQESRQALGRHSVGAMPWRGLL